MAAQFEILVYVKLAGDLDVAADRVFAALGGGERELDDDEDVGGQLARQTALGLEATLFRNEGEAKDDDFPDYPYGLSIVSTFADPELDLGPGEAPLADYYARYLAFALDVETATSFYMGSEDSADLYEIRAFRRNPQLRVDSGPTTPRVYIVDRLTVAYEPDYDDELEDDELEDEEA